jgi:hypothetical protein
VYASRVKERVCQPGLNQPSATSPFFSTISILNISTKMSTWIRGEHFCRNVQNVEMFKMEIVEKKGLVADGWLEW